MPANITRLVLSRPDRIGDVVISSSCFAPVQAALPGAEIHLVAQARMAPLFQAHPVIKRFLPVPVGADPARRMEQLAGELRQLQADCIVHLHSDPGVERAAAIAGIPRRIGFRENGDQWLTQSLPNLKKTGDKHEGFYNFDLLRLLGVPVPAKLVPLLTPDSQAAARVAGKLPAGMGPGTYAVLHVGAHTGKPRLNPDIFIEVASWLASERGVSVVLIGAEANDGNVAAILAGAGRAGSTVLNLCGQTDLAESALLLRDAAVVFGRDSGPAHLAAAMGARTVSLMMDSELNNSGKRWTPLGERSWVLDKPLKRRWFESKIAFGERNLRQFTGGEIMAALKRALAA